MTTKSSTQVNHTNQITDKESVDLRWKYLYKVGSTAALTMLVLMVVQIIIFINWPPPSTVDGFFALFENNWFLGLLSIDLLYMLTNVLMILIFIALYAALKRADESSMLIALVLGLVGIAAYFSSNPAFEMLSLSRQYAIATTEAQRAMLLGAGQVMLEIYKGTAFDVYYVLNAVAIIILSFVMLRSNIFNRLTAYMGIVAGILMIVPSTAGTIGLYLALASLVPWAILLILLVRRFSHLGQG